MNNMYHRINIRLCLLISGWGEEVCIVLDMRLSAVSAGVPCSIIRRDKRHSAPLFFHIDIATYNDHKPKEIRQWEIAFFLFIWKNEMRESRRHRHIIYRPGEMIFRYGCFVCSYWSMHVFASHLLLTYFQSPISLFQAAATQRRTATHSTHTDDTHHTSNHR